jgi:hypothetical protein
MTGTQAYDQPAVYEIKVKGKLDVRWSGWFEGLTITAESDGSSTLTGTVADQAALYGLLSRMRDLALVLVSVRRLPTDILTIPPK